jgi:hypothetical protein
VELVKNSDSFIVQNVSTPDTTTNDPSTILSITTKDGDIIHYKAGKIDFVEKKTDKGIVLIKSRTGLEMADNGGDHILTEACW